jgi:hypothetical protein
MRLLVKLFSLSGLGKLTEKPQALPWIYLGCEERHYGDICRKREAQPVALSGSCVVVEGGAQGGGAMFLPCWLLGQPTEQGTSGFCFPCKFRQQLTTIPN